MNIARDSLFKRLIKLVKETPTEVNFKINKSHSKSESIGPDSITTVQPGKEWLVKSSSIHDSEYLVSKVEETCAGPCIKCRFCLICIHSFNALAQIT